jgi:aminoglycoside phosphotransferase (APT) family kinase protein
MSDALAGGLAALLGVDEVRDLTRLSGGASRETWSFDAVGGAAGAGRSLILQRSRPGSERSIAMEGALLRAARVAGVPVAEVLDCSDDPAALGAPYLVMSRIEGETIARKILRDAAYHEARTNLTRQWGEALAGIHAIDASTIQGLEPVDNLTKYRETLDLFPAEPHPAFELAFRWLDQNRPPATPPVVVHGDFRLGNVIVGPEGLRAVLDWELAHLGDPAEDLAWLCVRAWRFGGPNPVGGIGSYAELLDAYAAASGREIPFETLRWWEVLGSLAWGVMCRTQAEAHLSGLARSHELAAIGRRVCENEHDVLLLLP